MKKNITLYSLLLLFCCCKKAFGQNFSKCDNVQASLNCDANPVIPVFSETDIMVQYNVKYSVKNKVFDISYQNTNPLLSDCGDIMPYNCAPDPGNLLVYNVYYPSAKTAYPCYKEKPLPSIMLFHGGGFSDCNDSDSEGNMDSYCREFAKRGFVAFDIHYRSGRLKDPNVVSGDFSNNYFSASAFLAMYRAFQDARGAVRSIIAFQMSPTPPPYVIDTDNMFVGGVSSGGIIAMSLAYYSTDMLYEIFGDAKNKLGTLEDSVYRGPGTLKFRVKGVLNLWGGTYMPATYASSPETFFQKNRTRTGINLNPPMIAFQGSQDLTVPVNKASVYYSSDSFFRSAATCSSNGGNFTLPSNDSDGPVRDLVMFGSQGFYNLLTKNLGIPSELYLDSDMKHGLSNTSDFGTDINVQSNKTLIIPYFVERAVSFFQAVVNNVAPNLVDTKFIDCENFRYGCSPDNNHENCVRLAMQDTEALKGAAPKNERNIFSLSQSNRTINLLFTNSAHSEVMLFDLYGRPLKKLTVNNTQYCILQCDQVPQGVYIIKVVQGGRSQNQKINIF